jgi:serine/threonine protein kinase
MLSRKRRSKIRRRIKHTRRHGTRAKAKGGAKARAKAASKRKGGRAQTSGTYGCVFYDPPLLCEGETKRREQGISKLMRVSSMQEEMREINQVQKVVTDIDPRGEYFLVQGIKSCHPAPLDEVTDKPKFDEICYNLVRKGIKAENVNKKLNELSILNIPYGGKDLDDYLQEHMSAKNSMSARKEMFVKTNTALIKLLKNGIRPLLSAHLFHNDLKAGNILVDSLFQARVIDWGLAFSFTENAQTRQVPHRLMQYNSIIYNWPISQLLFNQARGRTGDNATIATEILKKALNQKGHIYHLNKLFTALDLKPQSKTPPVLVGVDPRLVNTVAVLHEYLLAVLNKYKPSLNVSIDLYRFFTEVYSKNVDMYGFFTLYEFFVLKKELLPLELSEQVKTFLKRYCFSTEFATKPYYDLSDKVVNPEIINALEAFNKCCTETGPMVLAQSSSSQMRKPMPMPMPMPVPVPVPSYFMQPNGTLSQS